MEKFFNINFQEVVDDLLKEVSERQREVIERRFGLFSKPKETLDKIGRDPAFGVTRERIRQIEFSALRKIKDKAKERHKQIFYHFKKYLRSQGGIKRHDFLLQEIAPSHYHNEVNFLLTLGEDFKITREDNLLHAGWTLDEKYLFLAKDIISSAFSILEEVGEPLPASELRRRLERELTGLSKKSINSSLEMSKNILLTQDERYGLSNWPEVNPRFIRDKIYVILKKQKEPLHFTEIAYRISPETNVQTVHNELIRDSRFVLVGRGMYALEEWGYVPGTVKEIIIYILKEAGKPLTKEAIFEAVQKQRIVKKSTIELALRDKELFERDSDDKYYLKREGINANASF